MKINLQNYEEYFVRFIDNDLSKEEAGEVQLFLQLHPGLKGELDAFQSTVLKPDAGLIFADKEVLKRGITISNYEEYFVRMVENDLSLEEKTEVNHFLAEHPQLQHEMDVYKLTMLVADKKVVFPDKRSLKKREPSRVVPLYTRFILTAAVAASLLLIFFMKGIEWDRKTDVPSIAQQETAKPVENSYPNSANENNQPGNSQIDHSSSTTSLAQNPANGNEQSGNSAEKSSVKQKIKTQPQLLPQSNPQTQEMLAENIEPLPVTESKGIPYYHRMNKAPYLVPVHEGSSQGVAVNNNSGSSASGWLSLASVVGSEMLRLSGRGDLVKSGNSSPAPARVTEPKKDAYALSIHSQKFSFYHKFFNKKKSSTAKNK